MKRLANRQPRQGGGLAGGVAWCRVAPVPIHHSRSDPCPQVKSGMKRGSSAVVIPPASPTPPVYRMADAPETVVTDAVHEYDQHVHEASCCAGLVCTSSFQGHMVYSIEKGLLRFQVYQVVGEDALVIHETFKNSDELKFHLSKGTAEKYKKDIDKIATPECYFFRGPVSWTIRTYSRFLHLPATYSSQGSHFTQPGGTMSEGTTG